MDIPLRVISRTVSKIVHCLWSSQRSISLCFTKKLITQEATIFSKLIIKVMFYQQFFLGDNRVSQKSIQSILSSKFLFERTHYISLNQRLERNIKVVRTLKCLHYFSLHSSFNKGFTKSDLRSRWNCFTCSFSSCGGTFPRDKRLISA